MTQPSPFDPWLWSARAGEVAGACAGGARMLGALQARRLATLVDTARRDSPLFRRLLSGVVPSRLRLEDLPVTRKPELMSCFDEWVADPRLTLDGLRRFTADSQRIAQPYLGHYTVWQSSGSTGEAGIFVQDGLAMAVYDALEALRRPWSARRWLDPWYLGERIVFVGATEGHFAGVVSMRRLRRLNPVLAATLSELSFLRPTREMVAELNAMAPTILATYASAAVLLAEEFAAGRLSAQPREVWTGGETLTPAMRRFVEQTFDCPVIDSYGASEFLALASQCRCGRLHLNSDWAILESVDEHGRSVPSGELGTTTLLTNLANRVQPLLRYDLGDRIAVHAGPCECGSPLPAIDVVGRHDEMLCLGNGDHVVRLMPLALCTVLEDEAGLFDFQLEQLGAAELQLTTGAQGEAALASLGRAKAVLGGYLKAQGLRRVRIVCRAGHPLRRGAGGKVQRVIGLAERTRR
jgi:phenylacetate-CoA ligase